MGATLRPKELYELMLNNFKKVSAFAAGDLERCGLSLPDNFFEPIEAHLNRNYAPSENRIASGYFVTYEDQKYAFVMTQVQVAERLEDMLVMVPLTHMTSRPLEQGVAITESKNQESYFLAYLPKYGGIAAMAAKSSSPYTAVAFFYPTSVEFTVPVPNTYSYSRLNDLTMILEEGLQTNLFESDCMRKGVELMKLYL